MKSFHLFWLLLLAGALPGWAQVPGFAWQRAYGTAARNERIGISVAVPGPVGGFLVAGQQLVPNSAVRSQVFLVRTNGQGDTLWTRRFVPPLSLQPEPTGLAVDPQGNVLLTVSSVYSRPVAFSNVIKFNPTCDTIRWQTLYQPNVASNVGGNSELNNPYVAPDGNYVFLRTDTFASAPSVATRAKLIKVNAATGSQLWEFDFNQYAVAAGFGIDIQASNLARCAGGMMVYLDLYNPTTMVGAGEYLFIDFSGAAIRSKRGVVNSYPSDAFPVFQTLRDGNVLVARRQKIYKISTAAGTAGDTLWYTTAPVVNNYREWAAQDMVEDAAGSILLVGTSDFLPPGSGGGNHQLHLVRFTGRGVLEKDTLLRRTGETFVRSALLAPNGRDLIFSGYAAGGPIGGEDLLLARYTGFRPLATAPGAAAQGAGPCLALWPNPAGAGAAVRAALPDRRGGVLRIFDALGRQVGQQAVAAGTGTAAVAVASLPPGVYVLRYAPAGGGPPSTARLLRE